MMLYDLLYDLIYEHISVNINNYKNFLMKYFSQNFCPFVFRIKKRNFSMMLHINFVKNCSKYLLKMFLKNFSPCSIPLFIVFFKALIYLLNKKVKISFLLLSLTKFTSK